MRRFFKAQLDRVLKKLGKKPDINKLDFAFWRKERDALGAVLQPHINRMVEAGALTAYNTNPVTGGSGSKQSETELAFDWTLVAEEAALWAETHGAELITQVEDTTQRIVGKKVAAFVRTPGMTIGDLRDSLPPWFGQTRAQMIAVTETTAAYAEGQRVLIDRAGRAGLEVEPIWQTAQDELVCPVCGPNHGKPKKDGWTVDWPPAHPRCILPGNVVIAPGGIQAAAKSFYVGRGIEMRFADGRKLSVTENHPILTGAGWVQAKLLHEGDYVPCATRPERIAAAIDPDIQQVPTMVEEIFAAIKEASPMATIAMPVATADLHGEGHSIKGEIEIVGTDGLLLGDNQTMGAQRLGEHVLDGSNVGEGAFAPQSMGAQLGKANDAATASSVGRCHLCGSPLGRHASPFDGLGSGAASGGNVGGEQATVEGPAIDASLAREFVLRFARDVTAEQIVQIRDLDVACHVYDLQSDMYGLYITSGVITSNCRCWVTQKWAVPTVERAPAVPTWAPSMSRQRAEQWVVGSTRTEDAFHITTAANETRLKEQGFDLSRRNFGRAYGDGVYMALDESTSDFYIGWQEQRAAKRPELQPAELTLKTKVGKVFEFQVPPPRLGGRPKLEVIQMQIAEAVAGSAGQERLEILQQIATDRATDPKPWQRRMTGQAEGFTQFFEEQGYEAVILYSDPIEWPTVGGSQMVIFDPRNVTIINE